MSFDAHKNFAITTVQTAPTPTTSGTSLTVATGTGSIFPATPFNAVVQPANTLASITNAEVVRVTNITGDTLTITRAQESSAARAIVNGDWIVCSPTAKVFTDIESAIASVALPKNYLTGLTLSNNVSDSTNDIDIATGVCRSSDDGANLVLASALTKRLDASWAVGTNQGGLDTGSIANTTYHVWLIKRSDTGVVDALFSASASAPTMPTSYDYKRRIGSIVRSGATILAFVQDGDKFAWSTPIADLNAEANTGTSAVTRTLTVPTGIRVEAYGDHAFNTDANIAAAITDLSCADIDPNTARGETLYVSAASANGHGPWSAMTNTSAQVRSRCNASGAAKFFYITTWGWRDTRGK